MNFIAMLVKTSMAISHKIYLLNEKVPRYVYNDFKPNL